MKVYQLTPPPHSARLDYEHDLNPQQRAVVTAGAGPLLVIAGAGSGKTRTLTYRVAHLIDRGIAPQRILLCTFTNKAAREMLARVESLVEVQAREVWGGTFHHLANRLLREFADRVGHQPNYTILDPEDGRDLLATSLGELGSGARDKLLPRPATLQELISLAVNTQLPLEQIVLHRAPTLVGMLDEVLALAREYRERKRAMNAMDFDDLLLHLLTLLTEPGEIADRISERFEHVLVDEYQDTNLLQCRLVDALAHTHGNLTVVGDDAQSIYGFRGANPDNMLGFLERWPLAVLHRLEINYRSTPEILAVANASIAHNPRQLPKQLQATRTPGNPPVVASVRDVEAQAAFVAQRVGELVDQGRSLREIAVLYRAHHHSLELQVELTRRNIPFVVRSGVRFFEQAHIKDVLAHLQILDNPRDELSWSRVLRLQPGIGQRGAATLVARIRDADDPITRFLGLPPTELPPRGRAGLAEVQRRLKTLAEGALRNSAGQQIEAILDSGYRALLPGLYPNAEGRADDLEQLARYAGHFGDARAFLSELNLLSEFGAETLAAADRPEETLTLSTIHQAKGLEWKVVFVLWLSEGCFPHPRAVLTPTGEEEERRLFYVAITRTMDELTLISPLVADRRGQRRVLVKPSRFVEEIGAAGIERWSVEQG